MIYQKRSASRFRVVFAGSADWSTEFLALLLKKKFKVVALLTTPDRKRGRGQKISVSSIKQFALNSDLKVLQPEKLNDENFLREFEKLRPDMVLVVSYGKIFPQKMLDIPSFGFLNFHPSLLPEWRGPSPIQSAILSGQKKTGFSFMRLAEGMDDGPIIFQKEVRISGKERSISLVEKLVLQGKKQLIAILKGYLNGKSEFKPKAQKIKGLSISKIFCKEDGKIDWTKETAEEIDRKIRGLNPQIKTFCFLEKDSVKKRLILNSSLGLAKDINLDYGEYELLKEKGENVLAIKAKEGSLLISKLQLEGKKECSSQDFFQGYRGWRMT